MGQPIVVVEKPSVNRGIVRFETNRALTGMGHEVYRAGDEVRGNRPPDELARRLLARDNVHGVHINGSVVTVDLAKGHTSEGLKEVIEDLYVFYPETAEEDGDAAAVDGEAPESDAEVLAEVAEDADAAPTRCTSPPSPPRRLPPPPTSPPPSRTPPPRADHRPRRRRRAAMMGP